MVDLRSVPDDVLFGGVPVILGGDFAQILLVVPHGCPTWFTGRYSPCVLATDVDLATAPSVVFTDQYARP
jgi:hypothetical protein